MISAPSIAPLIPQRFRMSNGGELYYFQNNALELVKIDFTFEAGSRLQEMKCLAHAANQLFAEATSLHDAGQVADFLDFRGIVVERMTDVCVGNVSFYFLRRYAEELFPLIREMFDSPEVTRPLLDAYVAKRRQQLALGFQKTAYVARNKYYETLYGFAHPLGTYANAADVDLLTVESVSDFIRRHYRLDSAHIMLSGYVDSDLLSLADRFFSVGDGCCRVGEGVLPPPAPQPSSSEQWFPLANAVQSTIRIGRILPVEWSHTDYARFMVLNTVLGGYFGSRLMSNIREDKGYTYGIYSTTQIHRGSIAFYITADVAAEATQAAVHEVFEEIGRLQTDLVPTDELELVRNYMMGDFIRSIDGAFELSERHRQMVATCVDERLSTNLIEAVETTTPEQLMTLAQKFFTDMVTVIVGVCQPQ